MSAPPPPTPPTSWTRQECLDNTKYKIRRFLADQFGVNTDAPDLEKVYDDFCKAHADEISAAAEADYLWMRAAETEGQCRDGVWDNPMAASVHMTEGERACRIMRGLYKAMQNFRK